MPLLILSQITKIFQDSVENLVILDQLDFSLNEGETVALTGASGVGKTTLLQVMGLIDAPTSGQITIGTTTFDYRKRQTQTQARQRNTIRKSKLGFVYQYHYLLPELTAIENVMLPQRIVGTKKTEAYKRAYDLLEEMGLGQRLDHTLHKLSGGEQQRVAIARALVNNPQIVFADEPTGNLDDATAEQVLNVMLRLVKERKISMVIATHSMELASRMDRVERLHMGKLAPKTKTSARD